MNYSIKVIGHLRVLFIYEYISCFAFQTLQLDIKLQPNQITDLAERISRTIMSLTNIDDIIHDTRNDLAHATRLKGEQTFH